MVAPAAALAGFWLVLAVVGVVLGLGGVVMVGAVAAAIPLWFLANYTIDTAIAPWILPAFRRHPVLVMGGGLVAFVAVEAIRLADVPVLPHINWVLGWLLFQVAGFAWRDGLLPTGGAMAAAAAALWVAAVGAVTFGPWPLAMVHHSGLAVSPTHPPSLALLLFGAAYSATAIAFAPRISAFLSRSPRAWAAVVAGNAVALTVYLWHFTAFIAAAAIFYAFGSLPTAEVATTAWWLQKLPMMAVAGIGLVGIVATVSGVERRALLAPRRPWRGGEASMFATAMVISVAIKIWVMGAFIAALIGPSLVLVVWFGVLRAGDGPLTGVLNRRTWECHKRRGGSRSRGSRPDNHRWRGRGVERSPGRPLGESRRVDDQRRAAGR